MELGIKNKLALVTGASRGIGLGIATELAQEGARTILVARDLEKLKALQAQLPGGAERHFCISMDLMSEPNIAELTKTILSKFGAPDIVIHNLGGSMNVRDPFAPAAQWREVWQYNLGIVIDLNRALIPEMIKKKWGRIVHLSTLSTKTQKGNAAYVSAKMALEGYLKVVGREVAKHNIILSAVAPGVIYNEGRYFAKIQKENPAEMEKFYREHLPAFKLGTAAEVGRVVAFLSSEHAGFMTGSIVGIDGGEL